MWLGEAMMETTLGRFGDRRLEKGGPGCMSAWCLGAVEGFAFGGWVVIGRAKSG
jgi:hypothetical protein